MIVTPLYGHVSEETAYAVTDYPAGFRKRCEMKFWIEKKIGNNPKGYRLVTRSRFHDSSHWNAVNTKAGYHLLGRNLYLDENGHVECDSISEYSGADKVLEFVKSFPNSDFQVLRNFARASRIFYEKCSANESRSDFQRKEDLQTSQIWNQICQLIGC